MDIQEKKQEIINSLQNIDDEFLIDEVYSLLHNDDIKDFTPDELSHELQIKLSKAVEDYKQGRYITHEQMQQKIQQWLTQ